MYTHLQKGDCSFCTQAETQRTSGFWKRKQLLDYLDNLNVPYNIRKRYIQNEETNRIVETERGDKMVMKKGMRISGMVAGIMLTVLAALMLAEGIITLLGNPAFIFIDNMNRAFELVVGIVSILVAAPMMDMSRA